MFIVLVRGRKGLPYQQALDVGGRKQRGGWSSFDDDGRLSQCTRQCDGFLYGVSSTILSITPMFSLFQHVFSSAGRLSST